MIVWEDITSYRADRPECAPTAWLLKLGGLRLTIKKGHTHEQDLWRLHFRPFDHDHHLGVVIGDVSVDEAKRFALNYAREKIAAVNAAIEDVEVVE